MKKCGTECCKNLVKNSYTKCYDCNSKVVKEVKDDTGSEPDVTPYTKESIPRAVKNCMWIDAFQDSRVGKCQCCLREPITLNNFHAGHIVSERNGGKTTLDNLRCICAFCNVSMKTQNMDEFISRYNLHYNLSLNRKI